MDDLVTALQDGVTSSRAAHRLVHSRNASHLGEQLAGTQHRLRGHAGVEGALAADQVGLYARGHGKKPASPRRPAQTSPSGPSTKNHNIEFALAHAVTVPCRDGHRRRLLKPDHGAKQEALPSSSRRTSSSGTRSAVRGEGAGAPRPTRGRRHRSRTRSSSAWASSGFLGLSYPEDTAARAATTTGPGARRGDGPRQLRRVDDGRRCPHRHGGAAGPPVRRRGRSRLPRARDQRARISCLGVTEPDAGSDIIRHQDACGAQRRRVGHQQVEDLHHERPPRRLHRARQQVRPGRGLRRLHALPRRHRHARA